MARDKDIEMNEEPEVQDDGLAPDDDFVEADASAEVTDDEAEEDPDYETEDEDFGAVWCILTL